MCVYVADVLVRLYASGRARATGSAIDVDPAVLALRRRRRVDAVSGRGLTQRAIDRAIEAKHTNTCLDSQKL